MLRPKPNTAEAQTSQWPVPPDSVRYVIPPRAIELLSKHPLSQSLYPRAFGHYRRARGHHMRRDQHSDDLLIYCTEGCAALELGRQSFRINAGDLILLPAGEPHAYASDPRQPWTLHWVHYAGPLAGTFREYMGFREGTPIRRIGHQPRLLVDFNGLLSVRQSGFRSQGLVHASNRLRQLLSAVPLCIEAGGGNDTAVSNEAGGARNALDLDMVHAYMQDHLSERLTLEQLAALVGLSPAHFATRYRKATGVAPIQHFLHLKVEYACQLLDTTNLSFLAISAGLGYEDSYYFSRLFKKVMGQSPRHYRFKNRH